MGNSSVYSLSKYPTKWSFQNPFSNSETLFLWYSFMRIANGKDKFSFSSFLKICMTYRPNRTNISNYELVAKSLFRVMDIDSDDIIRFEDYLQTCFILTRGSIEAKLEILFYILKDQIGTKITKINLKKKLENLSLFVCPVRAKEMNMKFCDGDISKEHKILESIFLEDEKQISEQIFIQRFFKKVNEALQMICILELLLLPLAFGIEKKMKNKIYKLPLLYINAYELQRQSYSQYIINKKKRKTMVEPTAKKVLVKPKTIQEEDEEESNEKDSIDEIFDNYDPTNLKASQDTSTKKGSKGNSSDDIKQDMDPEKINVTNQRKSTLVQPSFHLQDASPNNRIPTSTQLASTANRSSRIIYSKSEEQIHDTFMSSMPNICTCGNFVCDCENKKRPKLEKSERQAMLGRSMFTHEHKHSPLERSFKSDLDKKVPLGIYMLCRELTKKVKSTPYTASKFEEIIWTKPNKANCQAIQSAFELNLAPAIITDDFTLAELLHSLKTVLMEMPSPLLTWSLSINALSIKLEKTKEHEKRAFLKNLLESIPSSHLSTINCLVECFSSISNGDKKIQSLLASFFGNCFVRFADPEDRLAYTPFDSVNFKASIETTPKDFVYFLLEEKSLFASFSYDEMSDFIDETVRTPLLQSLVTSQRLTLSYSDQYLSPLTNKPHSGSKNKTSNPSSSYSTESYYVSSNALSSSQRSDSRNSMDLEEINFNKKSTNNVYLD